MRIVIAGCRYYDDYDEAKSCLDSCISNLLIDDKIIIVSGCASGADTIGRKYAIENGFIIEEYPADWKKYGRSAGPKRNKKMAEICDFVICFWDGKSRGTKSMIEYAKFYNKPIKVINIKGN